jgi:transcriptional regulator with XRE-family HTH domain
VPTTLNAALNGAFGDAIRELRLARGLSQEALSFACGRHRTYVSLLERGHNSPSLQTIWTLAQALEIDPGEMIRLVEARMPRARRPRS